MGLESLRWENLVRIAETAANKYVDFSDELPGRANCGECVGFVAERLFDELGSKLFSQ